MPKMMNISKIIANSAMTITQGDKSKTYFLISKKPKVLLLERFERIKLRLSLHTARTILISLEKYSFE